MQKGEGTEGPILPRPLLYVEDSPPRVAERALGALLAVFEKEGDSVSRWCLALSGGTSPRPLHGLFSREPWVRRLPWDRLHIFWVDERNVPETAPSSNYGNARTDFLDLVPLTGEQIHPMLFGHDAETAVKAYEGGLRDFFGRDVAYPSFDALLLGIGEDGHTASLFPGGQGLTEKRAWVTGARGSVPPIERMTLTLAVLNHARHVFFLVTGKEKADIVRRILLGEAPTLPAAKVRPCSGHLTWVLDREAASLLPRKGPWNEGVS